MAGEHQQAGATLRAFALGLPEARSPLDMLQEWIEESYRAVAPKRLVAHLDQGRAAT